TQRATCRLTQCSERRRQREPSFPCNHRCGRFAGRGRGIKNATEGVHRGARRHGGSVGRLRRMSTRPNAWGARITTSVSSSLPTKPTWLRCGIDQALLLTLYLPKWQAFTLEQARRVFDCIIRPDCEVWVGTLDERVVAYLAMKGTYIDRLYVDPLEWRKGWGTQLVNIAKQVSVFGLEL